MNILRMMTFSRRCGEAASFHLITRKRSSTITMQTVILRRSIILRSADKYIDKLEDFSALAGVSKVPARVKCAVLAWHTLEDALNQ